MTFKRPGSHLDFAMNIIHAPDQRLLRVAEASSIPPSSETLQNLLEMLDLMTAAGGIGLAAPQVGWNMRAFVMNVEQSRFHEVALINPEITWRSPQMDTAPEGCLSLPGQSVLVSRPLDVNIRAYVVYGSTLRRMKDRLGEVTVGQVELRLRGWTARCAQHELDHLDGVLCTARGGEAEPRRPEA